MTPTPRVKNDFLGLGSATKIEDILRPSKAKQEQEQADFLGWVEDEAEWRRHWWGMPEYSMQDCSPAYQVILNFATFDAVKECFDRLGLGKPSKKIKSAWFPDQGRLPSGQYIWRGPKGPTRYPIYIPSKGRHDCQTTGHLLNNMGVPYKFVVEDTEADAYIAAIGADKVLVLPFNNLGQGSIPARNWIFDHAIASGAEKHWVVDDNLEEIKRVHANRRISISSNVFFTAIEDWSDRYSDIAMSGPNSQSFIADRNDVSAFVFNRRVYSCTLINNSIPFRWRGRYNEDTDLVLRCLKAGWHTALFNSFAFQKCGTAESKRKTMKGGNTDNVYNQQDYRLAFAQSLKDQHPDCVEVVWKFNRWHHEVDYSPWAKGRPTLKPGVVPCLATKDFGLELIRYEGPTETTEQEQELND